MFVDDPARYVCILPTASLFKNSRDTFWLGERPVKRGVKRGQVHFHRSIGQKGQNRSKNSGLKSLVSSLAIDRVGGAWILVRCCLAVCSVHNQQPFFHIPHERLRICGLREQGLPTIPTAQRVTHGLARKSSFPCGILVLSLFACAVEQTVR